MVNWAVMGDPNASLPTPQPVSYQPMFGAYGLAQARTCVTLLSQAAVAGVPERLGLRRRVHAVGRCRGVSKRDLVRNDTLAEITVDPETYQVLVDGEIATCAPATRLPLAQAYDLV